ncbi:MAG: ABC transporter ATP-binding protein [Bryobacteraceae bacterium]|jgi:ABC-2 type transport system ATP-binding protein
MLRTEGLKKKYGRVEALADLTLDVPEGAVFALIGPNGAGKTTAIKIVMNLLRATAGRAEVLGVDSRKLGPAELAQVGYVSENRRLPGWMSAGYFFSYCKGFYPAWRDGDLAELVRLYDLPLDRPLKAMSRGMRIKAAMAAALAYRPRLLVLDEPFGGLDVLVREEVIESILERTAESTVFLASHDLAELESFATHVGYLDQGRIQFVEEMGALSERFREVEVVLETAAELPPNLPPAWLNAEQSSLVVRFVHSRYEEARCAAEIRQFLPGAHDISARAIPLRAIFVALAKSAKKNHRGS